MKYIIDIPDDIYHIVLMDGIGQTCSFHRKSDLTPYTNVDIKEKAEEFGRGYDAGWDAGSKFHEAEKESIEDEVWEFAQKVYEVIDDDNDIFFGHSYHEMKERYEAWLKQKDEIHVGDEVTSEYGDGVVLDIVENVIHILGKDGICNEYAEWEYAKTGRHFDEVEKLLEKMRGEEE